MNKELNAGLAQAHSANPATRSIGRLQRYLEYAKPPNETELRGLLLGSSESPSCSKNMAASLSEFVLQYLARSLAHKEHKEIWSQVSVHFDTMLVGIWQRSQGKGISRSQFMRTWRMPLSMFLDMEVAVEVNESGSEDIFKVTTAASVEKLVSSSLIAAELFAPESSKMEVTHFTTDIDSRLHELLQADFDLAEVDAFKQICQHQAESLDDSVIDNLADQTISVCFLNSVVERPLVNPNDQWSFKLKGLSKCTAVSLGLVKRMPWERYIFGDSQAIPGCAEHTKLDESLYFDSANAREFLDGKLQGWVTAESCKKTVTKFLPDLLKMDKEFWMEQQFLEEHYDNLIETRMRDLMLEILPRAGDKRSLLKAVTAARHLSVGPLCMAQRKSVIDEMSSAANCLLDISQAQGPSLAQLGKMSHWIQTFHRSAGNFFHVVGEEEVNGEGKKKTLFGEAAMKWRMQQCMLVDGGHQDPEHMKEFRMYAWLLSSSELERTKEWQRLAVANSRDKIASMKQKALKNVEEDVATKKKARHEIKVPKAVVAPSIKDSVKERVVVAADVASAEAEEEDECLFGETTGVMSFFGCRAL